MERADRHHRLGQVAELLGRGDGAPQRAAQVLRGPDQRHRIRPGFHHAVLLPGLVDSERHRHQGERDLSRIDKEFIAGAKMYPKSGVTPAGAKELKVNAQRRTQASIGQVGEEDLYRFTAATDGRHVIDTSGPTDVVMKLFGPSSQTALIAEDDDSGVDTNARIAADLIAGDYFVQVRHYNRERGMGNYSVKVRRA